MPPLLGTYDRKHGKKNAGQTYSWHHRQNPANSQKKLATRGVRLLLLSVIVRNNDNNESLTPAPDPGTRESLTLKTIMYHV